MISGGRGDDDVRGDDVVSDDVRGDDGDRGDRGDRVSCPPANTRLSPKFIATGAANITAANTAIVRTVIFCVLFILLTCKDIYALVYLNEL